MLTRGLEAVERANQLVRASTDRCTRSAAVVDLRADCEICIQACPRDAIELDPVQVRLERCDGCRLCMDACPPGVFEDAPLARRRLLDTWKGIREGAPFAVACALAEPPDAPSGPPVVCLASLSPELLLIPLLLGASRMELRRGPCADCELGSRVEAGLDRATEVAAAFRAELSLGPVSVEERPAEGAGSVPGDAAAGRKLSRRGLFSALMDQGKATVQEAAAQTAEGLAAELDLEPREGAARGRWLRQVVAALLARLDRAFGTVASDGFAARVVVSDERCTRCGVCVRACPSDALVLRDSGPRLAFLAHRCVACGRCADCCGEDAVELEACIALEEWASREPIPLVSSASRACSLCGTESVLPGLDVCGACRREQLLDPP